VVVKNIGMDEANAFFDMNKERLKKPETVNASHILLKTLAEADEIITQLKDGANFEQLAKEKSLDPGTKINGGNLGYFGRGQMVKEFEETSFNLKVGEISAPVQSQFGFHVIKVYDKKPATDAKFEDLKEQIIKYLQDQENQKAIQSYINKLVDDGISSGKVKILYKEGNS
jgi:foldase protein PrsA